MSTPRRLRLTIDVDVLGQNRVRQARLDPAVDDAIAAAIAVLRDRLVNETRTLNITSRSEWSYNWTTRTSTTVLSGDEPADDDEDLEDELSAEDRETDD